MTDKESKSKDVEMKTVKVQHSSQLDPQEIVMNNARVLISMSPEDANEVLVKQLELVLDTVKKSGTEFSKDVDSLLLSQIGLATLSMAIEYWMAKQRQGRIEVYRADQMPKA